MTEFALPLGIFYQLPCPSTLAEAVVPLQEALKAHKDLRERLTPGMDNENAKLLEENFGASVQQIKSASDAFENVLNQAIDFPTLPRRTKQLIFASIVAELFDLGFTVTNINLEAEHPPENFWWVTGRVVGRMLDEVECEGTSFAFLPGDDKQSEGALLSACADAFIHCVYAAAPYFPWDRWNQTGLANSDV